MPKRFTDEVIEIIDGVEYPRSSGWIKHLEKEDHWRLYWRQQHLMDKIVEAGHHLLEIGPGTGFTTNYLRSKGMQVTTLDFDPGKSPDIVANIAEYEFPETYDAILAFEVFEHIPFDKLRVALPRIASACRRYLFFSIPCNKKTRASFKVKLPRIRPIKWQWSTKRGRPMSPYHFWEIDYNGVTLSDVKKLVNECDLEITREDEFVEHIFFACRQNKLDSSGA